MGTAKMAAGYSFPGLELLNRCNEFDDDALLEGLTTLVYERVPHSKGTERIPYTEIRDVYAPFHLVMNQRGLIAPAFRPLRRRPPSSAMRKLLGKPRAEVVSEENLLSNDHKVIDLHWLFCQCPQRIVDDETFRYLLTGEELPFDLAEQFASMNWKT